MERWHMTTRNVRLFTNGSDHSVSTQTNALLHLALICEARGLQSPCWSCILGLVNLSPPLHSWAPNALAFAWRQYLP